MSSRATSAHRPQKQRRRQIDLRDPTNRAATDHELLANLLAYSQGRVSAEPLLQRFHSLGHVLSAEPAQLAEFGIEASDVTLLRLVRDIACRLLLGRGAKPPDPRQLAGAARLLPGRHGLRTDRAASAILFLDRKNHLIADEVQQHGTVNHTARIPARGRQAGAPSQCLRRDPCA